MVSGAESKGVDQLVPGGRGPVEVAHRARRGRVHRQDRPEAHAERTEPRQADGPDREVGVPPVNLEPDRGGRPVPIPDGERVVRPLEERSEVEGKNLDFFRRGDEHEATVRDGPILGEFVEEVERVFVPDVIGIAPERPLQSGAAAVDCPLAEFVGAEGRQGGRIIGIGRNADPGQRRRVGVLPLPTERLGQVGVEAGRRAMAGTDLRFGGPERGRVAPDQLDGGPNGPPAEVGGIERDGPRGPDRGRVESLGIEIESSEGGVSPSQPRSRPSRLRQETRGLRPAFELRHQR